TGNNLSYAWYFNGSPIPGATTDTLIVSNVGVAQVGSYSVRVTDSGSGRSLDSRRVVVEISSQPTAGVIFQDKLEFSASGAAAAGSTTWWPYIATCLLTTLCPRICWAAPPITSTTSSPVCSVSLTRSKFPA